MSNVIKMPIVGKFDTTYIKDEGGNIIGITRNDWDFRIQRKGDRIAFVSEFDNHPFGELDSEVFNTILACWLMVDDVETLKAAPEGLRCV